MVSFVRSPFPHTCADIYLLAWYEWYPDYAYDFSGISFSAGDSVTVTVTATSTKAGTAVIKNNTTGKSVSKSITSSAALCEQDAEWIVEDFEEGSSLVPMANFGTVTFTGASAGKSSKRDAVWRKHDQHGQPGRLDHRSDDHLGLVRHRQVRLSVLSCTLYFSRGVYVRWRLQCMSQFSSSFMIHYSPIAHEFAYKLKLSTYLIQRRQLL
jgi:hypothetical protein